MCREESRGVNPSEFLLDQAKGEKFECSFRSIHVNGPRALKSGAIIMMFDVLCLYKEEYDIGDLGCARFLPVSPPNQTLFCHIAFIRASRNPRWGGIFRVVIYKLWWGTTISQCTSQFSIAAEPAQFNSPFE